METVALGMGFELRKPDMVQFQKDFATYVVLRENRWFRHSLDYALGCVSGTDDIAWFIYRDGIKVGGLLLPGNTMVCLYTVPWADGMVAEMYTAVREYLIGQGHADISAQPAMDAHRGVLESLGFREKGQQVVMIRPTETLDDEIPGHFERVVPTGQMADELIGLAMESDTSAEYLEAPHPPEYFRSEMDAYNRMTSDGDACRSASIVLRDRGTGKTAAACLIAMWEGLPLIFDVWVSPGYRRQGLAGAMIRHSLTALAGAHPMMRLFVAYGNPARHLYEKLGFMAGGISSGFVFQTGNGR